MRNIAVILAGGSGTRLGGDRPKQFMEVAGKPVLAYSVEAFERCERVDEIVVVVPAVYLSEGEAMVASFGWKKVRKVLPGGAERYASSLAAIHACSGLEVNLIFHDAARPLVSDRIIREVIARLAEHSAVGVALPTTDTIWEVRDNEVVAIPERSRLARAQTPQAFRLSLISAAYALALADPEFRATDDCGVVKRYLPQERIAIVQGEEQNMKLTHPEDILLLEKTFFCIGKGVV